MPSCNKETEDVFFDSVDCIRSFDSASSDYEIWRNQPSSVRERRERFLGSMGFNEFAPSISCCSQEIAGGASCGSSPESGGLERITECSGAVSRSWASCGDGRTEDLVCDGRETDAGNEPVDREVAEGKSSVLTSSHELDSSAPKEVTSSIEENGRQQDTSVNKIRSLWKSLTFKRKGGETMEKSDKPGSSLGTAKTIRLHVQSNRKRLMEFTGLFMGQEMQAHKGFIWTMKFSPDGRYLASGGEDGIVRIWRVTSAYAWSSKFLDIVNGGKITMGRKNSNPASVVIPKKVFKIEESPVQEFHGHVSDVLDLSWSKSNFLLSSSKDKTVRLWKVGSDECLNVFRHNNYVTCIQFNPVDDGHFISGSIDGKARLWGVSEGRVVDWADSRDIITALCYQPDGQGCIVGSITGSCCFYNASGNRLQLDAQICVQGRKKCSGNRITGIQFSANDFQRVMITSADSKVRIFYGVEVIHKYRGLRKSGSQMSASFTSDGRHIISVGEDSRVYVWNYDIPSVPSSRQPKSVRSCEHFFAQGVSVAIPWSGGEMEHVELASPCCSLQTQERSEATSRVRNSDRFSLGSWFSVDSLSRGSATWPEEKLPSWDIPVVDHDHHQHQHQHQRQHHNLGNHTALSATWGQVIVTAGWDGVIRTFHNYGLPVRQ
ncbi:WD repeat-containing protein 44-like [Macadamia integrifolia]|uniref:WD repeat-containing protein 44-like n=1 Tax=Macadamia integrifolia TaxID=60698 RepID=UPI001C4EC07F|nr:WD repeat-containing protein 44-like [Macadamia integrifolia]XP_042493159.1 WD repeat-containing protein 44-like [Macadamia integrifolia]